MPAGALNIAAEAGCALLKIREAAAPMSFPTFACETNEATENAAARPDTIGGCSDSADMGL